MAQFIKIGPYTINVDNIDCIGKQRRIDGGASDSTLIYFRGGDKPLPLDGEDEKLFEEYLSSKTLDLRTKPAEPNIRVL